jgi:AraC-like DNA-binding protein
MTGVKPRIRFLRPLEGETGHARAKLSPADSACLPRPPQLQDDLASELGQNGIVQTPAGETPLNVMPPASHPLQESRMVPVRFDTFDQPPARQFEAWHHHYRKVFDLQLADGPVSRYPAAHVAWNIRGLTLTRASMPPNIVRQWRHWTRPEVDDWILVFAPGAARAPTNGETPYLSFRSLPRSFECQGRDGDVVTLFLPRDQFPDQAPRFDRTPDRVPFSGMAALLADYLLSLEGRAPLLREVELGSVAEVTRAMVAACLAPIAPNLERARDAIAQTMVARGRKLILQNLNRPDLGPDMLARSLGMSRSALYRAFKPHGGVARVILQARLDEAHRRIATATRMPTVGDMALDLGFTDHSTFSRAFKQRFGYAPREAFGLKLLARS